MEVAAVEVDDVGAVATERLAQSTGDVATLAAGAVCSSSSRVSSGSRALSRTTTQLTPPPNSQVTR